MIFFPILTVISLWSTWLLIKARNRFKNKRIATLGELAGLLFGDAGKIAVMIAHFCTLYGFIITFNVYFGKQVDKFLCETFEVTECGYRNSASFLVIFLCLPIILQKRLACAGTFNKMTTVMTLISYGIICWYSWKIIQNTPKENLEQFNLTIPEEAQTYTMWNWKGIPLMLAGCAYVFDCNLFILNIYAEANDLKSFFVVSGVAQVFYAVLCMVMGMLVYIAFGQKTNDFVLFDLPNN